MNRYKFAAGYSKSIQLIFEDKDETHKAVWDYINSLSVKEQNEVLAKMAKVMDGEPKEDSIMTPGEDASAHLLRNALKIRKTPSKRLKKNE